MYKRVSYTFYLILACSFITSNWCPLGKVEIHGICQQCPLCPKGFGFKTDCLTTTSSEFEPECRPCPPNTFSSSISYSACKTCRESCGINEIEKTACTRESDRECICKAAFKKDPATGLCLRKCCKCETRRKIEQAEECNHMPEGQNCFCNDFIRPSKSIKIVSVIKSYTSNLAVSRYANTPVINRHRSKYTSFRSKSPMARSVPESIATPSFPSSETLMVTPTEWKSVLRSTSPASVKMISPTRSSLTDSTSSLVRTDEHHKVIPAPTGRNHFYVVAAMLFVYAIIFIPIFMLLFSIIKKIVSVSNIRGESRAQGEQPTVEASATEPLLGEGPLSSPGINHVEPAYEPTVGEFYIKYENLTDLGKKLDLDEGARTIGRKIAEMAYQNENTSIEDFTEALDLQLTPDSATNLISMWSVRKPKKSIGELKTKSSTLHRNDIEFYLQGLPESQFLVNMESKDLDKLKVLLNKPLFRNDWRSYAQDDFTMEEIEGMKARHDPTHSPTVELFKLLKQRLISLPLNVVSTAAKDIGRVDVAHFLNLKIELMKENQRESTDR
ncbi:uncharacterized protein LOC130645448 [Hydractinia symbiolongicarpus]|uniref:uncharacterized protein LOC130645448 n=1 Tax=Hydractinia symbiolongicarpus TaxID=13093 RepID=UPI00254F6E3F|nr:uncharacterized protein LOC130645448 [Hydractinia symbiolongicarpus]XP_057307426.1 uncharacterized protein LOC130645448 [Hydractinia symbiolongicarpus]